MKGREKGAKDRPCAVVHAVHQGQDGKQSIVLLAPITHTPPHEKSEGVEISNEITRHFGLDEQRQWIKTNEVNRISWDDAGITPASKKQWEYGRLPKWITEKSIQDIQQNARVKKMLFVKREVADDKSLKQARGHSRDKNQGEGQEH